MSNPVRTRHLSYTEISTAQTCTARWDFSYGGRLAGDTLKPRHVLPILSDGRAWGAGLAVYHQSSGNLLGFVDAVEAMRASIDSDLDFMAEAGVMTDQTFDQRNASLERLEGMLRHYAELTEPLDNLTRIEGAIDVPVLGRSQQHSSSRYRYLCYLDGFTVDSQGNEWLVEFKLRHKLQPRWVIELLRQYRWYAWARQRESGHQVVGILVDERFNALPRPPKVLKDGSVSTDKRQVTTPSLYIQACAERGQDPDPELVLEFQSRQWQQRVPIMFRPGELDQAGKELTSAGITIRDLDRGTVFPTRNASERLCNGCRYKRICAEPHGRLVDELFIRTEPKRHRQPQPQEVLATR
jgi:hypothetical protein